MKVLGRASGIRGKAVLFGSFVKKIYPILSFTI